MKFYDIKMCNFTIREVELHIFLCNFALSLGTKFEIIEKVPHFL